MGLKEEKIMKFGSFRLLEPSWPIQACNEIERRKRKRRILMK
jgi:hypothetical protein